MHCHHQASIPGAIVASLSMPWGEVRGDGAKEPGIGGYHLVWPRDLAEAAGGLLAAGAGAEALRVLGYLRATQMEDGPTDSRSGRGFRLKRRLSLSCSSASSIAPV